MKLALGTVQFGVAYGVANTAGRVTKAEAGKIVATAARCGFDILDTAIGYGCSEERLGSIGVDGWKVVTKLPVFPQNQPDLAIWAESEVLASIARLKTSSLYGLLLHRAGDLLGEFGHEIYASLSELKEKGLVHKIGVSIYDFDELERILDRYEIDLVQAPFSIVDRRLLSSGMLEKMKSQGIEVHVRSVFLQGLLLMSSKERPSYFNRWENLWTILEAWRSLNGLTPLSACIKYPLSIEGIDRVIVGVDSFAHFKEILSEAGGGGAPVPSEISSEDPDLVNPSRWKIN